MKVLVLHGYGQNLDRINHITSKLKHLFIKNYQAPFYYIEAPNEISSFEEFGWFTSDTNDFFTTTHYQNLDKSLEKIKDFINNYGPFDGIIGFSQGGVMTSILLQLYSFKFAIIISAYPVTDIEYQNYDLIRTPSLHVWGLNDQVVLPEQSELNYRKMPLSDCFIHQGKHVIPSNANFKKKMIEFVDKNK